MKPARDDTEGKIVYQADGQIYSEVSDDVERSDNPRVDSSDSQLIDPNDSKPNLLVSKSFNPRRNDELKLKHENSVGLHHENVDVEELNFNGIRDIPLQDRPPFNKPGNITTQGTQSPTYYNFRQHVVDCWVFGTIDFSLVFLIPLYDLHLIVLRVHVWMIIVINKLKIRI